MKLKPTERPSPLSAALRAIGRKYKTLALLAATILYTGLILYIGATKDRELLRLQNTLLETKTLITNKVRATLSAGPERLTIDIRYRHFQRLAYKREQALTLDRLMAEPEDYVPAEIRHNGQTVRVRLRLKGDWLDHLRGEKWSFRVKTRGEHTLFGMKRFSLQHPEARNYLGEWVFHQWLKREDVLSLRYDFVHVTLNGKDLGIYALEEHFEKRLIEHNQRREGPIVRFSEELMWQDAFRFEQDEDDGRPNPIHLQQGSGSYLSSYIDGFQTESQLADSVASQQYLAALSLLEAFRQGTLPARDVFDVQRLATFFAVCDLAGAGHAATWHNMRFYLNPITARLEPIGFDADAGGPTRALSLLSRDTGPLSMKRRMIQDTAVFEAYIQALERISQPAYLDTFFEEVDDELAHKLDILHREFPLYRFPKEVFYRNQDYLRSVLEPSKGLHAFWHATTDDTLHLELGTIQGLPTEVTQVVLRDSIHLRPTHRVILPAKRPDALVTYQLSRFALPPDLVWADTMAAELTVVYNVPGSSQRQQAAVYPHPRFMEPLLERDVALAAPNLAQFDFLAVDDETRRIFIKPGTWTLRQPLVLPAGYTVVAGPGTELDLRNHARILSRSPVRFIGTEEEPVLIHSSDSTGQGLLVMETPEISVLAYVRFDKLSSPSQQAWSLPGAVTFYKAPVTISHTTFSNNRSEDALNIVRTTFEMDHVIFSGTAADAFDGDFTKGRITNTYFLDCGNDAVDVSGSIVEMENVTIRHVGDKGLSAGEISEITARAIEIEHAEIAVASKDLSVIRLNEATISNSRLGFAVFQKKPEFGAASIESDALSMSGVETPYLLEEGSSLTINRQAMVPNRSDVNKLLYGVEYGKSSQ